MNYIDISQLVSTLTPPRLDPIVERLLKLLNPAGEGGMQPKRYVQEQAITTLAMVADASEATFAQVCFFPLFSQQVG